MPRCSICDHPRRQAIDDALFGGGTATGTSTGTGGTTLRDIAGQFGVAKSTLQRHKQHVGAVRKCAKALESLSPRKQAYIQGRLDGKSKRQAALDAGFTQSMANHAATKIETRDVRAAFAALIRETVPPERIARAIADGLDAMETKFFAEKGVVKDQRDVISWTERRQYAELAAKFGGYYAPDKREVEQPGGVILIIPDGPRTAATLAKPTVEGTVIDKTENGGPILVLPKGPGEDANG